MEEQGLVIAVRRRAGHVLVTVSGEIDIATAGQLRSRLAGPAGGGQQVIVDFSQVSFIDAAGPASWRAPPRGRRPGAAASRWPPPAGRRGGSWRSPDWTGASRWPRPWPRRGPRCVQPGTRG